MSDRLPDGWALKALKGFLDSQSLFCDGDWVESKDQDAEGKNRLIQLADIGDGNFIDKSHRFMNDEQFSRLRCTELKENDILIARMPEPLGRACLFPKLNQRCATVVDVAILRNPIPTVDRAWLFQSINSEHARRQIAIRSAGTTRTRISRSLLEELEFKTPTEPEQKKIARILQTVDEAIEKTEALIEKYSQIKAGMMQDLFTRGLTPDGKLRPPRSEAPELYQETPIGWIPKEWEIAKLGEAIGIIQSGWSPRCDTETAEFGEWGILKTTAVVWEGYDPFENKKLPSDLRGRPSIETKPDDILITRKGPVERVGVVAWVPSTPEFLMFPDTVFRTRLIDEQSFSPQFLALALQCAGVQKYWWQRKIGLAEAQVNLNHGILRGTPFPKPRKPEQELIRERIDAVLANLRAERNLKREARCAKIWPHA